MSISGSINSYSLIPEPYLVTTNESYFSKSTGRTEASVLDYKVIAPKNIWGIPGARQHDTHFSGATKDFFLFGPEKHFVANIWTGEYDTVHGGGKCVYSRDFRCKHA